MNDKLTKIISALIMVLFVSIVYAISFLITAGLLNVICHAFGWTWWNWRICLGIWLIMLIARSVFGRTGD